MEICIPLNDMWISGKDPARLPPHRKLTLQKWVGGRLHMAKSPSYGFEERLHMSRAPLYGFGGRLCMALEDASVWL